MSYAPADGVLLHEEEDGEGFMLHVKSGRYFSLNPAGLVIWRAITRGEDYELALRQSFPDVPDAVLHRDADQLVSQLSDAGLLVDTNEA